MIGDRIKARREELGMTQEELATKVGYKHKTSISRIEKNKSDIFQSDVVRFADALDTTPADLMGWAKRLSESARRVSESLENAEYDVFDLSEKEKQLVQNYRSADPHTRNIVDVTLNITSPETYLAAAHKNANPDAGDGDMPEDDEKMLEECK